jgi:type VI secretion system protein ImpA
MTSPQIVDIDAVLAPVSEETPAGADPRGDRKPDSLYYRVKDARNAARSEERGAVETGGATPEGWNTVASAAVELLASGGKDLEVAAWLVEALVRTEGFAGLRDGIQIVTGIVEKYWETCFPELDEDGIEGKVTAVAGLSGSGAVGTLIQPLRLLPITRGDLASYSLWNYEQASEVQKIADANRRQARIDAGAVSMEQFMQSVAETPATNFAATVALIEECLTAVGAMSAAFDAVAGNDAPPVTALRELLQQASSSIRFFAADKLAVLSATDPVAGEEAPAEAGEAGKAGAAPSATPRPRTDGYASRNDALNELTRLAGYFRKTEPQSPISYTLDEAVRRARLTLPELLTELSDDPAHVQRILLAAGIKNLEAPSQ